MTPEKAKAVYAEKLKDEGFKKALLDRSHPSHKQAMAEKAELFKVIYPE